MTVQRWSDRLYPTPADWDPVAIFRQHLERTPRPIGRAVEFGAGAGRLNAHDVKRTVGHLVGVDLSRRINENDLIHSAVVGDAGQTPFADDAFDLAFAIYVLEHLEDAQGFCTELARILRPGGTFLALTPNRYHYVPAVSRITPHSFHTWFQLRRSGLDEGDVFPTYYRLNSRRTLNALLAKAGFTDIRCDMIEVRPNYLAWSTPSFLAGAVYERLVNGTALLAGLRVNIIVSARKQ